MVDPMIRGDDITQSTAAGAVQAGQLHGLIALTNDAPLIRALQELATSGINVSVVSDVHSLTDMLLQNAGETVLIDTAALESPVTEVVDMISGQLPDLCLMVAGHSTDQQQLTSRLASKTVFRFVHKPASTQRLKLILDSAARPAPAAPVVTATNAINKTLAAPQTAGGNRIPHRAVLAGLAALFTIALATWLFWPDSASRSAAATPAGTANPAVALTQVVTLVSQADAALAAGKFVATDGSSAAEMYRAMLKIDPTHRRAREGFDKSIDLALRRAEESLLAGKLNDAGTLVAAVALLAPDNPRLGFLNTQISREQARINTDSSQRQAFESRLTRISAALATMKERLQRGVLIEPAANAVASFREAEAIGANETTVRAARETLVAALLTAADTELSARRPAAARRLVDAARSLNSSAPGIDVLNRRVDEVTAQLATPQPAASPPRAEPPVPVVSAPTPAPAAVATAPTPALPDPANNIVSAKTLKLLRGADPVYPNWALQQLISGWVEMEFTVATDGSVKDIKITNAQPKNTFNSAASSALARQHYAPVMRDGVAVTQRASIRMRFTAQDSK
ncbi:MAG: TonB family protein [Pseudomonadota bacterium]